MHLLLFLQSQNNNPTAITEAMYINKRKRLSCLLVCMLCYAGSFAQADEGFETNSGDTTIHHQNDVQLVRIKKGYVIGDGFTLISGVGNLNISPTLQTFYTFNSQNKKLTNLQSGFAIERARITVISNFIDKKLSFIGRLDLSANNQSVTTGTRSFNTTLQEAYVEYRPTVNHAINFGLRADYVDTRELRFQGENLGFVDRSTVSASFDAIFDYGFRYKGNYKLGGKHLLRPYVSITTGDSRASLQKNFGGLKYGIRLDYLPFDKFSQGGEYRMDDLSREAKPKLVIGVVYSYNDGASSATGTNGGRFLYGAADQSVLLPTYSKWCVDYLFKYDGFYSLGAFVSTKANVPTGIKGEFRLNGQFNAYSTTQTEEQTKAVVLSRLNLGSGFNFQAGYVFDSDWAFGVRYSVLNGDAASASFANFYRSYTAVVTKYIYGHNLKAQMQFGYDDLRPELKTTSQTGNYYTTIMFTVQL